MNRVFLCTIVLGIFGLGIVAVLAHEDDPVPIGQKPEEKVRSAPGDNLWNQGQEPEDWWGEIKRMHGHVGPWNVLGWRIGQAALRGFDTKWGWHELDIICYVPIKTPYSCMADGLVIGTGNSIGRLDIRLAEVVSPDFIQVCIRRKDGTGPVLIFSPRRAYLKHIDAPKPEELEKLSRECSNMKEIDLFEIERIKPSKISSEHQGH